MSTFRLLMPLMTVTLLFAGCGSDSKGAVDVSVTDQSASDSQQDLGRPDVADAVPGDQVQPDITSDLTIPDVGDVVPDTDSHSDDADSGGPEDADSGGGDDVEPEIDIVTPTEFEAVAGQRCTQGNRIGTVQVMRSAWGPSIDVSATINDRPEILGNQAEMGNNSCTFYKQSAVGFCEPACVGGTTCDGAGMCVPYPVQATDVVLTLTGGQQSQTFEPQSGGTWGTLTLTGDAFSADVKWGDYTVTLAQTLVPGLLENLVGTLEGAYDKPTGISVTWTPISNAGLVFTHIPINHHASGPTYTECAVDASEGVLHVPQEMLEPLAVITGLEFQGLEHVLFAAATTPQGCIEFKFGTGIYLNLN